MTDRGSSGMKIMVAIDDGEHASYALQFYLNKLHQNDNSLVFVHSTEAHKFGSSTPHPDDSSLLSGTQHAVVKENRRSEVEKLFKKFTTLLDGRGVKYEVRAVDFSGNPGEVIVKMARDEQVEMIVMGSKGRGTLSRVIMGSVSDVVVHQAHCPVLICHKEESSPECTM